MKRQPIQSKSVRSAGHDPEENVLEVEFASGGVYRYLNVPPEVYDWFLKAGSKGAFINRIVKEQHAFERKPDGSQSNMDLMDALRASLRPDE